MLREVSVKQWINRIYSRIRRTVRERSKAVRVGFVVLAVLTGNILSIACGSTELEMTQETESVQLAAESADDSKADGTAQQKFGISEQGLQESGVSESGTEETTVSAAAAESGVRSDAAGSAEANDAGTVSAGAAGTESTGQNVTEYLYVDVCGAVEQPGVYCLPEGARVHDAVQAAGGFSLNAEAASINQARKLTDQEQLYIYTRDEIEAMQQGETVYVPSKVAAAGDSASVSDAAAGNGQSVSGAVSSGDEAASESGGEQINLNTASAQQLETLPGIGEAKAAAIIAYRKEHGDFASAQDLTKVSGIGDSTYAKLKDYVCVSD